MKIRKICISLASKISKAEELLAAKLRPALNKLELSSVLCFHDISDDSSDIFAIRPDDFVKIIDRYGRSIRSFSEVAVDHHTGTAVSFDDGFSSTCETAYPLLKQKGIPFIVYVAADFIGRPGYMTEEQVRKLARDREICTIGSHMCSHRKTREMSEQEIRKEWADSKSILEKITGCPVEHAALPYGSVASCSGKSIRFGFEAGYRTVATTRAFPYFKGKTIPRYVYQNNKPFVPVVPAPR